MSSLPTFTEMTDSTHDDRNHAVILSIEICCSWLSTFMTTMHAPLQLAVVNQFNFITGRHHQPTTLTGCSSVVRVGWSWTFSSVLGRLHCVSQLICSLLNVFMHYLKCASFKLLSAISCIKNIVHRRPSVNFQTTLLREILSVLETLHIAVPSCYFNDSYFDNNLRNVLTQSQMIFSSVRHIEKMCNPVQHLKQNRTNLHWLYCLTITCSFHKDR